MLHGTEDVFDSRPRLRTNAIGFLLTSRQFAVTLTFLQRPISGQRSLRVNRIGLTGVSFVAPDARFTAVQHVSDHLRVMHVSRRHDDAVYQLGLCIDAYVALHAIIPLAALLRRRHLGIEAPSRMLRRRRSGNDRCIDDRTLRNGYAVAFQVRVDLLEERRAEALLLDPVAKLTDRRLIRSGLDGQVETSKARHRAAIVKSLFHGRIRPIKPLLQKVDAEHALQSDRRTTVASRRIVGSNNGSQLLPWNHGLHLLQTKLAASRRVWTFKTTGWKTQLIGHRNSNGWLTHKDETTKPKSCFSKSRT